MPLKHYHLSSKRKHQKAINIYHRAENISVDALFREIIQYSLLVMCHFLQA